MGYPVLARAIEKFAAAGEQAGFSVEHLIRILSAGVGVETLLYIIERRLVGKREAQCGSSRWVM